jgi:hypothetical protein
MERIEKKQQTPPAVAHSSVRFDFDFLGHQRTHPCISIFPATVTGRVSCTGKLCA